MDSACLLRGINATEGNDGVLGDKGAEIVHMRGIK